MTKSKVYLLDSNVLIALATPEHSLNARAAAWFLKGHRFATCPITQGALFRFHLRAGVEATAESAPIHFLPPAARILAGRCFLSRHAGHGNRRA
jgi:predicted nucleic acid-binding protein